MVELSEPVRRKFGDQTAAEIAKPEFNTVIFFEDGNYSYECRTVSLPRALAVAKSHTTRPAAVAGITRRVIITDGGDCIVFEWKFKEGVVWPTKEDMEKWRG